MAFDLYITFSGLCMLVQRKDELLAVLPRTHEGEHKHVAVFGSHRRYQPDAGPGGVFVEHELGPGVISLDDLEADPAFRTGVKNFNVADVTGCAGTTLKPSAVFAQVVVNQGAPCPRAICAQPEGARWNFKDPDNHASTKVQRLATSFHWRIRDVREEVDGREGLVVRITPAAGPAKDVTLRPVQGQLRMFIFHTLPDERPSSGPPGPKPIKPGEKAPHFGHYFDLFGSRPGADKCFPKFVSDDKKEERSLIGDSSSEKFAMVQYNFVGRRYSCVLATIEDPDTR